MPNKSHALIFGRNVKFAKAATACLLSSGSFTWGVEASVGEGVCEAAAEGRGQRAGGRERAYLRGL
jgi:hypothetical protein